MIEWLSWKRENYTHMTSPDVEWVSHEFAFETICNRNSFIKYSIKTSLFTVEMFAISNGVTCCQLAANDIRCRSKWGFRLLNKYGFKLYSNILKCASHNACGYNARLLISKFNSFFSQVVYSQSHFNTIAILCHNHIRYNSYQNVKNENYWII